MKFKNHSPVYYFVPLAALIILLSFFWQKANASVTNEGSHLPNFNLPTLYNPALHLTNQTLQGHVSLLNFWASWCHACQAEHAMLLTIKERYRVPIYGVNYMDDPSDAKSWLESVGNPYVAVGSDTDGYLGNEFNIDGTPETFIVDKHGVIRYQYLGVIDDETWKKVLWPIVQRYQAS